MTRKKSSLRRTRVPQRTCVVCRAKSDKRALMRLVKTPEGVFVDPSGKQNGRGAYLCDDPGCWDQATTTNVLDRALRALLTEADRARLRAARPA